MKDICRVLSKVVLALGTIGSMILAGTLGKETSISAYGAIQQERNWGTTIIVFLAAAFSVFLMFVILSALGEILENQERIMYSQTNSASKNKISNSNSSNSGGTWTCPECDTVNSNSVRMCKDCGYTK
ncbi:MAG: hypothetical protein IJ446_09135 [Oscillospiraceae bacterium]|nr:hypothetical protein [Oscillospiraceae bacterium]